MQISDAPAQRRGITELRTGRVYVRLREAILRSELDADVPISQVQLASRLGVSRTPLREALRMLEREGLIRSEPNRQVRVASLGTADLEGVYATRIVLETFCLCVTLPDLTEADLAEMQAALAEMELAGARHDAVEWEAPHSRFHRVHMKYAGERPLRYAVELADHSERYRKTFLQQPRSWASAAEEHSAIYEASRARDVAAGRRALSEHLARTALTLIAQAQPDHDPAAIRAALQFVM